MKKLFLLAFFVLASPTISLTASAEKIYKDLVECVILSNNTPAQKLASCRIAQAQLQETKEYLQRRLSVQYYFSNYPQGRMIELGLGYICGLYGTTLIARKMLGYLREDVSPVPVYFNALIALSCSAFLVGNKYLLTKLCTKKIKEIDTVLVRLETLKKELEKECYFAAKC